MENVSVDAIAKGKIAKRLHRVRLFEPASRSDVAGERLRADDGPPVGVADGRSELCGLHSRPATDPELTHRDVARAPAFDGVEAPVPVGLGRKLHPVLVRQFPHVTVIVRGEKVGDRPAEIPEEPLTLLLAIDDSSGDDGKIGKRIVAPQLAEVLPEFGAPVLGADFVAVDQNVVERLSALRSDVRKNLADERVPVTVQGLLAKLVDLESVAFRRSRMVVNAGGNVAHAENRPVAFRDLPNEMAGRVHVLGQHDQARRGNRNVGVQRF